MRDQALLHRQIEPLVGALPEFMRAALAGKPGRRSIAAKYFQALNSPAKVAYIATKVTLDKVTVIGISAQRIAVEIGTALEDEARCMYYQGENKALFNTIIEAHQKRAGAASGRRRHLRKMLDGYLGKKKGLVWESWPEADRLHCGWKCLKLGDLSSLGVALRLRPDQRGHPSFQSAERQGRLGGRRWSTRDDQLRFQGNRLGFRGDVLVDAPRANLDVTCQRPVGSLRMAIRLPLHSHPHNRHCAHRSVGDTNTSHANQEWTM